MNIKDIRVKHALIYGAIIGGTITFYQILLYVFGMTNNKSLENVSLFLFVLGIFITVKRFRDIESEGVISFKKAFSIAFLTCVVIGIIGGLYTYFQFKYLSPNLMEEIIELSQEKLLSKGIADDQVELQSALMDKFLVPGVVAFLSVLSSLLWGAIMSLIVAALLKRNENPLLKSE